MGRRVPLAVVAAVIALSPAACSSSPPQRGQAVPSTTVHSSPGASSTAAPSSPPDTAVPAPEVPAPVVPAPVWQACRGSSGPSGFQCATVDVPRNPQDPAAGGTIGLALDRHPASGRRIGSLLINPGGPGASGVDFLPDVVGFLPRAVLDRFDIVGFDPPGVARSAPVICLDGPGLDAYFHEDPAPPDAAGLQAAVAEDRVFAQGCQARSGAELPYVSTVDAAMDMDFIRRAVGDPGLTYLGFSYGTFLGATYADLYPSRIRAMVLDGALDPSIPVLQGLDQQSAAFDGDLRAALAACVSSASCPWKPAGDPVAAFEQMLQRVRVQPLPVRATSRVVGPAEFLYGTGAALYSTTTWSYLHQALARAAAGDGTDFLSLFDSYTGRSSGGQYTNEFEANAAVNCLDSPAPSVSAIEAHAPASQAAAPVFGVADLYSELGCAVWPVAATGRPAPIHAAGSPPIVVVGTTGDPATPYEEARALASQLVHGVLLTRVGNGHTAYPYSSCIRNYVDAYLVDLTVPPSGVRCPTG